MRGQGRVMIGKLFATSSLLAAASVLAVAAPASSSVAGPAAGAKKRCHVVKKKVRGKTRRVRVCRKVRPKKPKKPATPRAKNVSLTLEHGRAASATVGPAGGTVAVQAASGARITVAIPAGALSDETTVTATPVSSMSGVSRVRLVAGVELGPDGTVLAQPATVSFELPGAATRAFGVAWFGTGHNVHRYPVAVSGNRATASIVHFSGVGVGQGDPGLLPKLETSLTVAYAREVRPLLRRAVTDDTLFTPAVDAGFRWLRAVELVGLQDRFRTWWAEAVDLLEKVFANAIEKASERCRNHDLSQLARLLKIDQKAQGLGFRVPGPSVAERFEECARFELELVGEASVAGAPGRADHSVRGSVPIRIQEAVLRGAGDLVTTSAQITVPEGSCASGQTPADGPLFVDSLRLGGLDAQGQTPAVSLVLRMPGIPVRLVCPYNSVEAHIYDFVWAFLHQNENSSGFYAITDWQWIGGAIVARKEYNRSQTYEGATLTEHTTLVLKHTPGA